MKQTPEHRFWDKVDKTGDCWIWTAGKTPAGYGRIQLYGRPHPPVYAHRISYTWAYGEIPEGMHVLHRCDNPACVKPEHLFIGTHADNMADRNAKGRTSHGMAHASRLADLHIPRKLTKAQVWEIRKIYSTGIGYRRIAQKYSVSPQTIQRIIKRKIWNHI